MIRAGTYDDIKRCIEMSHKFYLQTEYCKHIPMCEDSCEAHLITSIDQGLLSVYEAGGEVHGFVMALAYPCMMNSAFKVGAELAWWVEPEHRGGAGIKLLKHLEDSARKAGIKVLSMMLLEAVEPEKVARIYNACGYTQAERTFLKVF